MTRKEAAYIEANVTVARIILANPEHDGSALREWADLVLGRYGDAPGVEADGQLRLTLRPS
jgi:hypothetical protein